MTPTYECPACGEWLPVPEASDTVPCPECKAVLSVDRDAEFTGGLWRDLTRLHISTKNGGWNETGKRLALPDKT